MTTLKHASQFDWGVDTDAYAVYELAANATSDLVAIYPDTTTVVVINDVVSHQDYRAALKKLDDSAKENMARCVVVKLGETVHRIDYTWMRS